MSFQLISITEYCSNYQADPSFIAALQEEGIIEIIVSEENSFLLAEQIPELEKYTRWYYEMGINREGIDAIRQLLQRINNLQEELRIMRNRLSFYESINELKL
ncbi:chaperone modulator CbpM [Flavihumibacter profundi]|uniref:chaperone modulator CbpM n=1 Tax=Flavihumibacter profundi TaxID=2716883 RepID=UPI001CC46020|nr:chaperone modulator CbpM [Flavihumibacter profundi]MBZ5856780.1 chaperone modulator CbpM [Flavihumibacter profundi]